MIPDQFYQRVGQVEYKELIDFIDHNQTEITIKVSDQFVKTNVNYVKNEKFFSLLKFHEYDFSNEPISCTFRYKDDIFVFSSHLNSTQLDYVIDIPEEIFQLQRRNDFRINIPMGTPHECKILALRGLAQDIKVELRDLSMGGCQLSVPAFKLEIAADDLFSISLVMDKFEFTQINLKARHIKKIENQDILLVGGEFIDLVGENSNEMRSLIMSLDRKSRGKT